MEGEHPLRSMVASQCAMQHFGVSGLEDKFSRISRHCILYRHGRLNTHRHSCKNTEKTCLRLMLYLKEDESRLMLAIGNHSQVKPPGHLETSWKKNDSWCTSNCHWLLHHLPPSPRMRRTRAIVQRGRNKQ